MDGPFTTELDDRNFSIFVLYILHEDRSASQTYRKETLRRPRHGWEDNIRMDLKEIGINMMHWVDSDQDKDYSRALVNAALHLRVP